MYIQKLKKTPDRKGEDRSMEMVHLSHVGAHGWAEEDIKYEL